MSRPSWLQRSFHAAAVLLAVSAPVWADSLSDKVDKVFEQWDKADSPGCALGVIQKGELIYKRGYGMANLEHGIPLSSTSVFRIGSTSKQFTALSILLLAEDGKLSVDDDIRKYLPKIPDYGSPVTIRHLIHHTSGLRDYLTLMDLAGKSDHDFYTDEDVVEMLARQRELNFAPGEEYLYSNSGYFLLSQIVKRATGRSLRDYAQERIFEPLGMKNTHFHDDHTMVVENRASGYSPKKSGGYRINMTALGMVGDGGVFTSVEDLLLWDRNYYGNKLGGEDLIARMLSPGSLNNGEALDYAFGLRIREYKGLRMVRHGGAFVGFRAEMIRFPDQQFSVVCLCNLSNTNPSRLARQVADTYLAAQFDKKGEEESSASAAQPEFIELSQRQLESRAGAFRNPKTGTIWKLAVKEGKLAADVSGFSFLFSPLSESHFRAVDAPAVIDVHFIETNPDQSPHLSVRVEGQDPVSYEPVVLVSPTPTQLRS